MCLIMVLKLALCSVFDLYYVMCLNDIYVILLKLIQYSRHHCNAIIEYILHMDESQQVFGCYSSGNAVGQ